METVGGGKATSFTGEKFRGLDVLLPSEMRDIEYDYLYIATNFMVGLEIYDDLKKMEFPLDKIRFLYRHNSWMDWKYQADDAGVLVSKFGRIKIYEKSRSDHFVIFEIFARAMYNMDLKENTVVIDAGMNIGAATLFFASNPNVEKVYGIEPFPDTYESALENIMLNDAEIQKKIRTFNYALADFDGDREIAVLTENSGDRTTEIDALEEISGKRKVKIKYRDAEKIVKDIIAENEQKHIVIKIDTEGSEFSIFRSIKNLLRRFDAIVMEYHRSPGELLDMLRENGYRCVVTGVERLGMIYAVNMNEAMEG